MIYIILAILVGVGIGWWWAQNFTTKRADGGYHARRSATKEKRKREILRLLQKKKKISNDDVEKTLGVSDASATNYLEELERAGKIRQVGKTGRYVYYEKV